MYDYKRFKINFNSIHIKWKSEIKYVSHDFECKKQREILESLPFTYKFLKAIKPSYIQIKYEEISICFISNEMCNPNSENCGVYASWIAIFGFYFLFYQRSMKLLCITGYLSKPYFSFEFLYVTVCNIVRLYSGYFIQ